jgi:outer membrane protein OmpA-like peptidoglycan-associated protein
MNVKAIIWVAFVIVLLIIVVKCENSTPVEEVTVESEQVAVEPGQGVVVTEEIVVNQTAATVTTTVDDYIELTGAVMFAHDSAILSDDGKAIIDERIAKYRGKVQNTMDIEVIGYSDITGKEDYNQKLSIKRAQAVADYIEVQTDIPHTEIKVIGKGSSEAGVDMALGAEESKALDRRVVVHFQGVILQ